jgi:hypothetical protein
MKRFLSISALLVLAALSLVACGGGSNGGNLGDSGANSSAVFVTGEDAPLPSVLSYNTTITSIALNGTSSTPAEVLSADHGGLRPAPRTALLDGIQGGPSGHLQ